MLRRIARRVPARAKKLIARFWPGPLTLVLSKKSLVPSLVTAGLGTVAVRMPEGLARDLVRLAGVPVAAPSANLSGRPSPTTAAHVAHDFPDLFVLDGGPTRHGLESTVVAFDPPRILRQGAITEEDLKDFLGKENSADGRNRARSRAAREPRTCFVAVWGELPRRESRHEVPALRPGAPFDSLSERIFSPGLRGGAPRLARPLPRLARAVLRRLAGRSPRRLDRRDRPQSLRGAPDATEGARAARPRRAAARPRARRHGPADAGRHADRLSRVSPRAGSSG